MCTIKRLIFVLNLEKREFEAGRLNGVNSRPCEHSAEYTLCARLRAGYLPVAVSH